MPTVRERLEWARNAAKEDDKNNVDRATGGVQGRLASARVRAQAQDSGLSELQKAAQDRVRAQYEERVSALDRLRGQAETAERERNWASAIGSTGTRAGLLARVRPDRAEELAGAGERYNDLRRQEDALEDEIREMTGTREANLFDLTIGSVMRGYQNSRYGEELYDEMYGRENESEQLRELLGSERFNFEADGRLASTVSSAAEQLGQWARQVTNPLSLAAAGTGAVGAAVAGQAGPQVLAPEEIVTVPGAFFAGLGAGAAASNYKIEAGLAYQEMLDSGVSADTAKIFATGVGAVNAALEFAQLDDLTKSFRILQRTGANDDIASRIASELARRGVDVAKETGQEVAQEGVTIAGTQFASQADRGEWAYNTEDVMDRLGETALSSALTFGLMNVPGGIYNVAGRADAQAGPAVSEQTAAEHPAPQADLLRQAAEQAGERGSISGKMADRILSDQEAMEALTRAAGEVVQEGMTQSQRRAAVKEAVNQLAGQRAGSAENSQRQTGSQRPDGGIGPYEGAGRAGTTAAEQAYELRRAQRAAEVFGENGRKAFQLGQRAGEDQTAYFRDFARAYQAGMNNQGVNKVSTPALTQAQKGAAYEAGRSDGAISLAREKRGAQFAQTAGKDSGLVFDDYVADTLDPDAADQVNRVAKALGVRVRFVDSVRGGTANAQLSGSDILVERNNPEPVRFLLGHEMTHRLQELAPEEYRSFREAAAQDELTQAYIQEKLDSYSRQGVPLSYEQALDEVTADYAGRLMEDGKVLEDFIERNQGNRTLLEKVRDAIRALWRRLTGREKQAAQSAEARLSAALEAGARQAERLQSRQSDGTMGTPRYSIKDLTEEEQGALLRYKSGESYQINAKLRDGAQLTGAEQAFVEQLDAALEKMPVYEGTVYRRLSFDLEGREAMESFLEEHEEGEFVRYPAFTSTSTRTDGYPVEGDLAVTQVIEGQNGRDLNEIGNNFENEVVFPRMSTFLVGRVETDSQGKTVIHMREVAEHGAGQLYSEERHAPMQQVQEISQGDSQLRDLPGVDSTAEAGGRVSGLRAEGGEAAGEGRDSLKGTSIDRELDREIRQLVQEARAGGRSEAEVEGYLQSMIQSAFAKERQRQAERAAEMKARQREKDAAARTRRSARELRGKIERHVKELSKKLLRPSDKQHIPEQLHTAVAAMLDAINLESQYTVDQETGRRQKNETGAPVKRTEAFRKLREAYASIAKEGADYTLVIDPDLVDNLTELEAMRDIRLADMNLEQLSTVWATIRAVEASIRTANRMLGESRFQTISQVAEGIRNDNIMRQDRGDYRGVLGKVDRLVNLDMLTPQSYFHRMGPTGDALFRMLRSAQDRHIEIMRSAQEATRNIIGSVDTAQLERETHTFDVDGQTLTMSTAQIMALYELMKRQQAQDHIFTGGIRPEAVRTGRGLREDRRADAVHVTAEDLAEITGVLTEEQIKIADALQKYMGNQLAELGNQASMEVYGYRKFTEPNYFPIQVDRNQTQQDIAKEAQAQTIAGRGFTKGTVPKANNAVMVGSIFDIFASHVNDMATYSAWLPTMENVRRIRDFTFRDSKGNRTGTVKSIIERVFGRNGNAYLNKLVDDLNQGVRTAGSGSFMDSIVGNYKAAAVAANLRVIIQQPTSILRALNALDPKYLLAGTVRRGDWEKVMKYAPIARWKDWGYFDINTGRQMKDVLLGSSTRLEKLRQAGMAGAGKADSFAWARLWNAVEAETKDRRPELKPGTDAFYRAVGERFSEIVDQTQVVDGILQRSQIMRSADALTKISTSFMGEPTKSYNMFTSALYDLRHATSQQARNQAKRTLARTSTALAVSFTVNAVMQSLVDALRDDDKETDYWEKVFQAFTGFNGDEETMLDYWNSFWSGNLEASYNPLAYMPYFKDLVSIAQGYDVTRMDMEAVEKVWSAFTNMRKALTGEGRYSIAGASANMLAEVARLFGLPVANLKRDVQAAVTTAAIETDNYLMQYRMDKALLNIGYQGNRSNFMDILYAASVNDPEAYEIIYEDMAASGITEQQIRTAMEQRMKKDQGVERVDDLSRRYLTPKQDRTYDRLYGQISGSSVWSAASAEQRAAVEEDLYNLAAGTDAGLKLQEKIDTGAAYGISEADYLLYLTALEIADSENEDPEKRNGSIDQAEAQAAIDMLAGLSDEERAYLWQSTKNWSEKNNPYR